VRSPDELHVPHRRVRLRTTGGYGDGHHKHAKEWAANGAIMEDIISNFELAGPRLLRICPTCGLLQDKPYDLAAEQKTLAEPCPNCGFNFPVAQETPNSTAVFKDIA